MRRALGRSASRLLRSACAAETDAIVSHASRAGLISALHAAESLASTVRMPNPRTFTSSPTWALPEEDYSSVFYPEPEVEVGSAAPPFSLPGET
jgi:hypothetical protein